jgi:glycosyltransferase involved in cell wall biosynthesis
VDPSSEDAPIEGIAAAMTRLAGSPELRHIMGNAGRRRAEDRFSWDKKVDTLLGIFSTLNDGDEQSGPFAGCKRS